MSIRRTGNDLTDVVNHLDYARDGLSLLLNLAAHEGPIEASQLHWAVRHLADEIAVAFEAANRLYDARRAEEEDAH